MAWPWYRDPDEIEPGDGFAPYRLQADFFRDLSADEWHALSKVGRCAWYWQFVNDPIRSPLVEIDRERWIRIKLEHWTEAKAWRVCGFLDVEAPEELTLPHAHPALWPQHRPTWTEDERRDTWRFVQEGMEKW